MEQIFCADDVVAKKTKDSSLGVVERTHGDIDTHDPRPGRSEHEQIKCDKDIHKAAFTKFMKDGVPPENTVLVRWQDSNHTQLILESKLKIIDRSLLIGDIVKKNATDAMSGVVINTFTKCTLQPISDVTLADNGQSSSVARLKGLPPSTGIDPRFNQVSLNKAPSIEGVPSSELKYSDSPTPEDLVIFKDWIGRVEDVNILISLRLSDGCVVEIKDDMAEHLDGTYDTFSVGDIASTKKGVLRTGRWIYGKYNPNTLPVGTVVATRLIMAEISWLERRIGSTQTEPHGTLERLELESDDFHIYDRTRRLQSAATSEHTTTVSNSEIDVRLNLRVRFKDLSGACVKYDGSNGNGKVSRIDRKLHLGYDLNVYDVSKFQTEVTVQWQDLSITREPSTSLIPESGIDDEHDAWPGEVAHLLNLDSVPSLRGVKQARKVGVVQSVDAQERMAEIRWSSDACVQYSEDDEAPGLRGVVTGVVGIAEGEVEEVSLYDVEAPGELNVRRGDIVLISNARWESDHVSKGTVDQSWLGEIVDTQLNGLLTVRLGAANPVRDVDLRREDVVVAIRSDMTDEPGAWDDDEFPHLRLNSDGEMEVAEESEGSSDERAEDSDEFDMSSDEESEEHDVRYEDENGEPMDAEDVENEDWESDSSEEADAEDIEMEEADLKPLPSQPTTGTDTSRRKTQAVSLDDDNMEQLHTPESGPDQYLILSTPVPISHAFYLHPSPSTSNAAHAKRTQKEHRILSTPSNLPPGVYVRTWESRLDLLRVLFVGPEGTPYAFAPFIIDFHLPPSFPTDPPQAFFHAWTVEGGLGGVGRVNPNLYEDGKICLSLLGTWETSGKGSSEGWNAGRSTLLQVLVSLLGLVLVPKPYFNEAGYEHLAGLESSRRASEWYSERVFLKARTFVLAALSSGGGGRDGVQGLEDVLEYLYCDPRGKRLLERCIVDLEGILRRSEGGGEGLPPMSKGACISLRKVLERLVELRQSS